MEDDSSNSGSGYEGYSFPGKKATQEKRKTDSSDISDSQKIVKRLETARQNERLGLVKSELVELTELSPGRVETVLIKLASQGEVTFRDFPDPELVEVEKPAVRVWYKFFPEKE